MIANSFNQTVIFLVNALASLYLLALMIYLMLRWQQVSFANPLMPVLAKFSKPVTFPFRQAFKNQMMADLYGLFIGLILLQMAFLFLIIWLQLGFLGNVLGIFLLAAAELLNLWINICFYSLLISVILSWVAPFLRNTLTWTVDALSEPIVRPFRRVIPSLGGLDLSPLIAMLALQGLKIFAVSSLRYYGMMYLK